MEEKDRCCCLIFDEMALNPNLQYDQKNDCIGGCLKTWDTRNGPSLLTMPPFLWYEGCGENGNNLWHFIFQKVASNQQNWPQRSKNLLPSFKPLVSK
jgi:hypothetical protein